jgi:hypothetical protein
MEDRPVLLTGRSFSVGERSVAKLKVGDPVKLNIKAPFDDYERTDTVVKQVWQDDPDREPWFAVEGSSHWFLQGGDWWQGSNRFRDRFYEIPPGPGGAFFTRI